MSMKTGGFDSLELSADLDDCLGGEGDRYLSDLKSRDRGGCEGLEMSGC